MVRAIWFVLAIAAAACRADVHFTDGDAGAGGDDGGGDGGVRALGVMPAFSGPVNAMVHAGNAWYVGGNFTRVSPYSTAFMAQLDGNGQPMPCLGGFDDRVFAVARYGNALYAGGSFTHYRGAIANGIAKIDVTTCELDPIFNPQDAPNGVTSASSIPVFTLVTSTDSLYVGGCFSGYRGGVAMNLAKIDLVTGALDTTFSPANNNGFEGCVEALALSGTALYVGGDFTSYKGVPSSANHIAKLHATTGVLDTTFTPPGATSNGFPGPGQYVYALAISGGSLYVGGNFTGYKGVAGSANHIAKLDITSGALDTTFSPPAANGFDGAVTALAVVDTSLYVGGDFRTYRGATSEYIAKVSLGTGLLDTTFGPPTLAGFDGRVRTLAFSGSALYVGGYFTKYRAAPANFIAKLDLTNGVQDTGFAPPSSTINGFDDGVASLVFDGASVWAGGYFTVYGGDRVGNLVKLDDATLAIDKTFKGGFDDTVHAIAAAGNALYVGGEFTKYDGRTAISIAKLDVATGALDATFSPSETPNGFAGAVYALAATSTALYVGGEFSAYRGVASSANGLAKLDLVTGAIDTTFNPPGVTANGFDGGVYALAISGTSLFVGGQFNAYRGITDSANNIAKLALDTGAQDITFSPPGATGNGFSGFRFARVLALAVAGNAVYAGGLFRMYRGGAVNMLAKLDITSGILDTGFSPPAENGVDSSVLALAASGGSLYVGGEFTQYRGVVNSANHLAKLDATTGLLDTAFSPVGVTANGFPGDYLSGGPISVNTLTVLGDVLAVGGHFVLYRGRTPTSRALLVHADTGAP